MKRLAAAVTLLIPFLGAPAAAAGGKAGSLLAEIEQLDREMTRRSQELDWVDRRIRETTERITTNEAEVGTRRQEVAKRRSELKRRSRRLYRMSREGLVGLLLGGDELIDLRSRYHYLQVLLDRDVKRVGECRAAMADLARRLKELDADRRAMSELRRALAEAQRAAEEQRQQKQSFLRKILSSTDLRRKALDEGRAATRELGTKIADAGRAQPRAGRSFRSSRGKLPCPVAGTIRTGFGTVRDDKLDEDIRHPGISLDAARGAEVKAVHGAKVAFAGYFKGFGRLVILDHGEGFFTLYAHLGQIKVSQGAEVEAGTLLGTVGDTGSVSRVKLYFELRFRGRPINPARWVRCARGE